MADGIGLAAIDVGTAFRANEIGRNDRWEVGREADPPTTLTAGTEGDRGSCTLAVDHSDRIEGSVELETEPLMWQENPLCGAAGG